MAEAEEHGPTLETKQQQQKMQKNEYISLLLYYSIYIIICA